MLKRVHVPHTFCLIFLFRCDCKLCHSAHRLSTQQGKMKTKNIAMKNTEHESNFGGSDQKHGISLWSKSESNAVVCSEIDGMSIPAFLNLNISCTYWMHLPIWRSYFGPADGTLVNVQAQHPIGPDSSIYLHAFLTFIAFQVLDGQQSIRRGE